MIYPLLEEEVENVRLSLREKLRRWEASLLWICEDRLVLGEMGVVGKDVSPVAVEVVLVTIGDGSACAASLLPESVMEDEPADILLSRLGLWPDSLLLSTCCLATASPLTSAASSPSCVTLSFFWSSSFPIADSLGSADAIGRGSFAYQSTTCACVCYQNYR